jgi:PhnB protein
MREITPYLNFDGDCRAAMTFYQQCLGGELYVMSFAEANTGAPPEHGDRVMHARLRAGGALLMASDTMPGSDQPLVRGSDVWLHLGCESDAEVDERFAKLADGGTAVMAPQDTFWNARFGMVVDRYGFRWMLNHEHAPAATPA